MAKGFCESHESLRATVESFRQKGINLTVQKREGTECSRGRVFAVSPILLGFLSDLVEARKAATNRGNSTESLPPFSLEFQGARRRKIGLHGFPSELTSARRLETILYLQIPFPHPRATLRQTSVNFFGANFTFRTSSVFEALRLHLKTPPPALGTGNHTASMFQQLRPKLFTLLPR